MNSGRGYARRLLLPALLTVLLLQSWQACSAREAKELTVRHTHLSGAGYFPTVRREIRDAKESITVTMYLICEERMDDTGGPAGTGTAGHTGCQQELAPAG